MKIIVDFGATSGDWRLIAGEQISQRTSAGFNPFHQTPEELTEIIQSTFSKEELSEAAEFHLYGAGILPSKKAEVVQALSQLLGKVELAVHSDLVGAARGLCGDRPGIACILGTGSNSGYYDGQQITAQVPPLGYVLGDEGSGAAMGKRLLKDYLRAKLPQNLKERFEKRFEHDLEQILQHVYREDRPSAYLGTFSRFVLQNIKDPYMARMVYDLFKEFLENVIYGYPEHKSTQVHFVGSIAFYFSNLLRQVGNDMGVSIGTIMETPIAGLALYHRNH
ncbi:MAG: N-acetylglucosamine kinase [Cyclobacteriaceae bacterium]